jgi:hypothetical protein
MLQRDHFTSARKSDKELRLLVKPTSRSQRIVQESRPLSCMEIGELFLIRLPDLHMVLREPTSGTNPQLSFGRGVSQVAAASDHACFLLGCDRVAFLGGYQLRLFQIRTLVRCA